MAISSVSLMMIKPASAQYAQNGAGCLLVSGINMTSPSNTTYTSNSLTLNFNIESIFDNSIYQCALVYSIDGNGSVNS